MKTSFRLLVLYSVLFIHTCYTEVSAQVYSTFGGGLWNAGSTWVGGVPPSPGDSVIVNGPVSLNVTTSVGAMFITTNGILQNASFGTFTLDVTNSITNNGIIRNNNFNLILKLYGNVNHNGVWTNYSTTLYSTNDQSLTFTKQFNGAIFGSVVSSKTIHAITMLEFKNTNVDLGSATVQFPMGSSLSILGGYLANADILGDNLNLRLNYGAYLQNVTTQSVELHGEVNIGPLVTFNGFTTNKDTLQNRSVSVYGLTVLDGFRNEGLVRNNNYNFILNIAGDVAHTGTWSNFVTNLTGDADQELAFDQPFNGAYLSNTNTNGIIYSKTNLSFINTVFDLNDDTLHMDQGNMLNFSNSEIENAFISCFFPVFHLNMANSSYLRSVSIAGNDIELSGTVLFENDLVISGNVINQGAFKNRPISNYTAYVNGSFTNNGTVSNNNYNLYLHVFGDLVQNGIWNNNYTYLNGYADQNLSFNQPFQGQYLINSNASGKFTADTDLTFQGTSIDLGNDTLIFTNGLKLTLASSVLSGGRIFRNGTLSFEMTGGSQFSNTIMTAGNLVLFGSIDAGSAPITFNGDVNLIGTLRNIGNGNYTVSVIGDLTNQGTITNNNYSLYLYVTGDIYHNGVWNNQYTYLNGSADQHLLFNGTFDGSFLINSETSGKIISTGDLRFVGTSVDLNNDTLLFLGERDLEFNGGDFREAVVISETAKSSPNLNLNMFNEAVFSQTEFNADTVIMSGTVQFTSQPIVFNSNLKVLGTFRNFGNSNYYAAINGSVINMGTVTSNNYYLSLYIRDDIYQHGIWQNHYNYLTGSGDHILDFTGPLVCSGFINNSGAVNITATSDLQFNNAQIDLNGANLIMESGSFLKLYSCYILDGSISGPGYDLGMRNGSYMSDLSLQNPIFRGIAQVLNNVVCYGETVVKDTLRNYGNSNYSLLINGSITNYGLITNNNYNLYMTVVGDLANGGTWQNNYTLLDGPGDQNITLMNGQSISGQVRLDANAAGASTYLWYFNGGSLPGHPDFTGATTSTLFFQVPVSTAYAGQFYCGTNAGNSRSIYVGVEQSGVSLNLHAFLEGPFNGSSMGTQLNSSGILPLSQPFNTAPWNYNGSESVSLIPNPNVVDWLLVELRDAPDAASATSATIVARQAAFLLNDGTVVGQDGYSFLSFNYSVVQSLFVVIRHRNHIAVMSSMPLVSSGGIYQYDFSSGAGQAYGGQNSHKQIAPGIWGMTGADGNADNQVNNGDKNDVWATQAGTGGYKPGDFNLDAQVNNTDKNELWKPNTGLGGQVPQ